MSQTTAIVEISGLAHTYLAGTPLATQALVDASLIIQQGQIAALVGPSGAGKSTIVHYCNGLLRPSAVGQVTICGLDTAAPDADLWALRRHVGLVFQSPQQQMIERFVGDDIAYGPLQLGLDGDPLRQRVREAMDAVGLDFAMFVDRDTTTLSGGEVRRVAIAGALALDPDLLILDEATTGLDPLTRDSLCELLVRLARERELTILMVTNDMDQVAEMADTVWVLHEGRTVAHGTPAHVFSQNDISLYGLARPGPAQVVDFLREAGMPIDGIALNIDQAEEMIWQAIRG